jgi:malate dehydrogenase (oxaloacetate-decarboxylating)(NADP+)
MNTPKNLKGYDILYNARLNKSTAFSAEERERLGLRGLLPACVCDQETQKKRVMENLRRKAYDIERYIFLIALQERSRVAPRNCPQRLSQKRT